MSAVRLLSLLLLLAATATSFHFQTAPRANFLATRDNRFRGTFVHRAAPDDGSESESESSDTKEIDKAIAAEYARTGLPEDSSSDGFQIDSWTM